MNTDAILERVLDRLDAVADSVAALNAKTESIVDRLDKINGSVSRHQEALTESKLWQAAHEAKPKLSDQTVIKVVAMICGTALTIYGVQVFGLVDLIVRPLR